MALLTDARRSVWTAIDNWTPLKGAFRKTYRFDSSYDQRPQPFRNVDMPQGINELPALAIRPARLTGDYLTNQTKIHPFTLEANIWTPGWDVTASEGLWEDIVDAMFRSKVSGENVPEVKRVTYYRPQEPAPGSWRFGRFPSRNNQDEGDPFTVHTFAIVLRLAYDPENES